MGKVKRWLLNRLIGTSAVIIVDASGIVTGNLWWPKGEKFMPKQSVIASAILSYFNTHQEEVHVWFQEQLQEYKRKIN